MRTHNTWGIPGPVFLVLFAVLSATCVAWGLRNLHRARNAGGTAPLDKLTPTEIGMLISDRNAYLAALEQPRGQ